MQVMTSLVCAGTLALASLASAQTPAAPQSPAAAQKPAAGAVSAALKQNWESARRFVRESATQMDEANYAFKPVDTVRTFGQILAHVAGAAYVFCASAKGEKEPFAEDHFEKTATTKAAIVKAVDDSLAYCDPVYDTMTDAKGSESVTLPFGMGTGPRSAPLILNYGHFMEHYGNLVTYFRIKGMVPPSSAPRK